MSDRPNARVSMFAPAGMPRCETCCHLKKASDRHGGWCQHPANRVISDALPGGGGFTPSQAWDGSCTLHPERIPKTIPSQGTEK